MRIARSVENSRARPTPGKRRSSGKHVSGRHVSQSDLVERAVGRGERDELQNDAAGLQNLDALLADGLGQARHNTSDAILHVDRRKRDVRSRLERRDDFHLARRIAGRLVAQDVGCAV